ncbi:hypothetical protein TeGR_g12690 [Tetraparma gracilis]|uniref:Urease accessory protein n=1 Tax=Tetraparma gracilis TaxID=2962635 RepID=A0ABQ6MIG4_9STRA|nr:hypothetical protein TeGR_g12690 [Tetraparma gracilis]
MLTLWLARRYVLRCKQLGSSTPDFVPTFLELDRHLSVRTPAATSRRASCLIGVGMLRAYGASFPSIKARLAEVKRSVLRASSKEGFEAGNAACVFGLVAGLLGLGDKDAARCYLYTVARDMVSAATRMNVVGPIQGQEVLADVEGFIEAVAGLVVEGGELDMNEVFVGGGIGDGLASAHERLYSRLFNS